MKVKIVKATGEGRWYRDKIGQVYDVITFNNAENRYIVSIEFNGSATIDKEDVEIVEEEKSCDTCLYRDIYCLKRKECNDLESWKPLNSQWVETADASKIVSGREQRNKIAGVGMDAPTITNEKGGKQSKVLYAFDALDSKAMFAMCKVMKEGRDKYGSDENWRMIPARDHWNHMVIHAFAWMAGDKSDEHLSHIMCRAMMLYATAEADNG